MPFVGIGVGIGRQRFRGGFVGLLDEYSGAAAAYSLRQLSSTYTGDAIRVRRASDNTEQDIGFVNNVLDTASLTTFCSGTDGFVTTWYDQSGNGVDATQTTAANQPQIVSSGSVILDGGKPAIQSTATNGLGTANTIGFASMSNFSVFSVQRFQNSSTLQFLLETSINYNTNAGAILVAQISSNTYDIGGRGASYNVNGYTGAINGRSLINSYLINNASGSGMSDMYANNNVLSETNGFNNTVSFTNQRLFLYSRGGTSLGIIGTYQELILYPFYQLANQSQINTNINTHYAIY